MTVSIRDASREPRTEPPTGRGLIDPHHRYAGKRDGVETCGRCGGDELDVWITIGATSTILKCVGCRHVQEPEEVSAA